jgi:hypothetical protein
MVSGAIAYQVLKKENPAAISKIVAILRVPYRAAFSY